MKLTQVKGNTWVVEANEWIPLYKLDDKRCVLLDTGLLEEREELERALLDAGLTPVGILCSHAHVDHCANNAYFQEKYGATVALTFPEAGMCSTLLNLKCYFLALSPGTVERESGCMVHEPDLFLPLSDGPFDAWGVRFQLVHTPGHSSGHICTVTPDNVCYAADALLSRELLRAKLPYNLSHQMAMESREKLRGLHCDAFIMAHRGVCPGEEMDALIDANQELILRRAGEIAALIDRPMAFSQINAAVCRHFQLFTRTPRRALRFERNIRFFVEFLLDRGDLVMELEDGVALYTPAGGEKKD